MRPCSFSVGKWERVCDRERESARVKRGGAETERE